ncbi:unnamed protein product [Gulo gulo]|uniref:Uncharacterized protein n=1 Tax=Gulo gulo TaxID=48420 RepID=A0A9X9LBQ2_GULGU|nr:unnamed protein product [Gulo gulo]
MEPARSGTPRHQGTRLGKVGAPLAAAFSVSG